MSYVMVELKSVALHPLLLISLEAATRGERAKPMVPAGEGEPSGMAEALSLNAGGAVFTTPLETRERKSAARW